MRQPSSADPSSVRQWNERAVITALRDAGTVRVAQVADRADQRLAFSGEFTVVALAGATGSGPV